jgi:hypothetical protein
VDDPILCHQLHIGSALVHKKDDDLALPPKFFKVNDAGTTSLFGVLSHFRAPDRV